MRKEHIIKRANGKQGLIRKLDNELIVPIIYDRIEFMFDNFIRAKLGSSIRIINSCNETVFEMKIFKTESDYQGQQMMEFDNKQYFMFMAEQSDGAVSFYGRPTDEDALLCEELLVATIFNKKVSYKFMKESELEPAF